MPELNTALAHLAVEHGHPEENLAELLYLFRQAADEGARIAVGPEMSLSSHCFEGREESCWPRWTIQSIPNWRSPLPGGAMIWPTRRKKSQERIDYEALL